LGKNTLIFNFLQLLKGYALRHSIIRNIATDIEVSHTIFSENNVPLACTLCACFALFTCAFAAVLNSFFLLSMLLILADNAIPFFLSQQ
jgi:hypothetical protein